MGHIPRQQFSYAIEYAHLQKEVVQLQEANNVLNSELHRAKELLRDALPAEGQLAEDVEEAEDRLWSAQDQLELERSYVKGFASVAIISALATLATFWGLTGAGHTALEALLVVFGLIFGFASLISAGVVFAKVFGGIPEAKRRVENRQRILDRTQLRKMGIK